MIGDFATSLVQPLFEDRVENGGNLPSRELFPEFGKTTTKHYLKDHASSRSPDAPWDLKSLRQLRPNIEELFNSLAKNHGDNASAINQAATDYRNGKLDLRGLCRTLSETLGVIFEIRFKNGAGEISELARFQGGKETTYPGGKDAPPLGEGPVYRFTLQRDGNNKWRLIPSDFAPQDRPMSNPQNNHLSWRYALDTSEQVRRSLEQASGTDANRSQAQKSAADGTEPVEGKTTSTATEGTQTSTPIPAPRPEPLKPVRTLISHSVRAESVTDENGIPWDLLTEDTKFQRSRPVEGDPIWASGPVIHKDAAGMIKQRLNGIDDMGGDATLNTCWALSGLYALMRSEDGAAALRENVKFNEPSSGRATVHFPGFKTTVELSMEAPLNANGEQVYSDSAPEIELLVRAVDILSQHRFSEPVHAMNEAGFMFKAFGLDTHCPLSAKSPAALADNIAAALSATAGSPVTFIWGKHVRAAVHFDPIENTVQVFDPLDPLNENPDKQKVFPLGGPEAGDGELPKNIHALAKEYDGAFGIYIGQKAGSSNLPTDKWIGSFEF